MTTAASVEPVPSTIRTQLVYWMFYRDGKALSCCISIGGDLASSVHLIPMWDPRLEGIETFSKPSDAIQRHAEIASYLRDSGWLVGDRGMPYEAA